MKIAIIHLSDFHIQSDKEYLDVKIEKLLTALNILGKIDDYAIVFSGDLANSGKINEYKSSRHVFSKIIRGIKQKNENRFINLMLIPGNHDLCLPKGARDRKYIQEHYENKTIRSILPDEIGFLDNFYNYSHAYMRVPYDKILDRRFCTYGDYKIQFILINTAPFSTLEQMTRSYTIFQKKKCIY